MMIVKITFTSYFHCAFIEFNFRPDSLKLLMCFTIIIIQSHLSSLWSDNKIIMRDMNITMTHDISITCHIDDMLPEYSCDDKLTVNMLATEAGQWHILQS